MWRMCVRGTVRVSSQGIMPIHAMHWWIVKILDLAFLQLKNLSHQFFNSSAVKANLKPVQFRENKVGYSWLEKSNDGIL